MEKSVEDCLNIDLNRFTVFVFSPELTNGLAYDFIGKYKNTPNYIDDENSAKRVIDTIFSVIEKYIQPIVNIVAPFCSAAIDTPVILNNDNYLFYSTQLLTSQEHKAIGLNKLNPIILSKKNLSIKFINKLANIFYNSPLKPTIIILENNNYLDITENYKNFPTNTLIKHIDNSLNITESIIFNEGVENYNEFINCIADRCFDTCANTNYRLLINNEFNDNIIKKYTTELFQIHTNLLYDRKEIVENELAQIIEELNTLLNEQNTNNTYVKFYLCIALINETFCNDYGGNNITTALEISNELNNAVLKAHIDRYCDFLPNISLDEKNKKFIEAENIFNNNRMFDHAFYCRNNKYVDSFSSNNIDCNKFQTLVTEAKSKVPGMCGLVHIINNAGVAFLYERKYYDAIDCFNDGISRITNNDRMVQKSALEINKIIAEFCISHQIQKDEFVRIMDEINSNIDKKLYFIKARYYMNLVSMAYQYDSKFGNYLLNEYDIVDLVNKCILQNKIGAIQLQNQIKFLEYYIDFPKEKFSILSTTYPLQGKRMEFILTKGLNPFHFKTWL